MTICHSSKIVLISEEKCTYIIITKEWILIYAIVIRIIGGEVKYFAAVSNIFVTDFQK